MHGQQHELRSKALCFVLTTRLQAYMAWLNHVPGFAATSLAQNTNGTIELD